MPTRNINGLDLPVDERGRVDISAINRYNRKTDRTPSEWGRCARFKLLLRNLQSKTGKTKEQLWHVEGVLRHARTWVDPEIAKAYVEDLGIGTLTTRSLSERLVAIEMRVSELEEVMRSLMEI